MANYDFTYHLKSGDLLSVQISSLTPMEYDFFNKEKGSNSQLYMQNPYLYGYLINEDGNLRLPVLGSFYLRGKSLTEARKEIQRRAERYFSEPSVKVNVLNYYVTILGEVNDPGRVSIIEPNTNLLEVIGLAGDLTNVANRKKIKIIRTKGQTPEVYYVDLRDKDLVASNRFYLQPNDIIYVQATSKRFVVIENLPMAISTIISAFTLFYLLQPN
ncbi:MAG: polysaccharide biosynthesis/export family protein [Rhodobacteraceae bacterium]|nr:polysaccharide biosynthesis/export family protein [Paracoccaceae bacterium]